MSRRASETPPATAPIGAGELLQVLRDGTARTKSEIAALTGMSRAAVSARIEALSASNLIHAAGAATSTGGRPPAQLSFNPGAGRVLAIDLGATHATVAVTNLNAEVLGRKTMRSLIADGPTAVLDRVFATARTLLEEHAPEAPLLGVGIGVPGPVEHSTGRLINPPIMPGWHQFDIAGQVADAFGVPGLVDNDVNVLALGEQALSWPDVQDLVFVKVATGIGAGIILGGHLQRGAQGSAGDIGHVHVPYTEDSSPAADGESDLEARASGMAIAATLRATGIDASDAADVVTLLRDGNAAAIAATRQSGREIGEVLAMLVNVLNPSVVVLGGSVARAGEHLLAGVREVVYRRSIPLATQELTIVGSRGGETAAVSGAAIMVIQRVLSPQKIDSLTAAAPRTARD